MMRVVVAGGKLQGIEAAYLAHQAGWSVLLIDREASPPARGLCDQFCQLDILVDSDKLAGIIKATDFIIPALKIAVCCLKLLTGRCTYSIDLSKITSKKNGQAVWENGYQHPYGLM